MLREKASALCEEIASVKGSPDFDFVAYGKRLNMLKDVSFLCRVYTAYDIFANMVHDLLL